MFPSLLLNTCMKHVLLQNHSGLLLYCKEVFSDASIPRHEKMKLEVLTSRLNTLIVSGRMTKWIQSLYTKTTKMSISKSYERNVSPKYPSRSVQAEYTLHAE